LKKGEEFSPLLLNGPHREEGVGEVIYLRTLSPGQDENNIFTKGTLRNYSLPREGPSVPDELSMIESPAQD